MRERRVKVKVIGSGKEGDPFRVDLPTYAMVPGSEEYTGVDKKVLKSVEVLVPADEVDEQGQLSKAKIRAKYKGQAKWDHDKVTDAV